MGGSALPQDISSADEGKLLWVLHVELDGVHAQRRSIGQVFTSACLIPKVGCYFVK
ncbi:hypothetical protein GGTG_05702 [Gaeumannomyces tritici R3-111a-1]|uniref:Uncharacterized protein n=1 Tax=Gaeumannomyces tritici (strain R3-111a-1) TaxID=644352 RepID=J3NWP0_GAET3|nr:hypothetical protein GGTG_05702 [Gaeumannomyces tritici R3-111a-1]EJT75772.1 hypothetical protein GGTG_05702 [Gaeumannomyces tritici R3-111a-1]